MSWKGNDDFKARLSSNLLPFEALKPHNLVRETEYISEDMCKKFKSAAVLIGLRPVESDFNILLTLRSRTMASHPGQVAFPGGKIDSIDRDPVAAALREAHEEVGLSPNQVQILGCLPFYLTSSGYHITTVVGQVPDDFTPNPNPCEVETVFETPASFLMCPNNFQHREEQFNNRKRHYLSVNYNGQHIWGVTAGIITLLYQNLYNPI